MFRKKKEKTLPVELPACQHRWKDFPWFIKESYSQRANGTIAYEITIYEPYCCIWCKVLKTVELYDEKGVASDLKDFKNRLAKAADNCGDHLLPRVQVFDMIEDMRHNIDREYLDLIDKMYPHRVGSNSGGKI